MTKISQQSLNNSLNSTTGSSTNKNQAPKTKVKRTRKTVPRDSPPQRSSIYRGVTRHRWTGRYEAHLWDKNCWNEGQNKKGRQVYLGAYDGEESAAHAYDLAALKYWGQDAVLNFPLSTYEEEFKEMECQTKEEYISSLRRKSSGFSRGVSKYRGVARHHHNGRWEARIGRVLGNKYLYLGTYATQEEAATAYDMAAIEYRGLNAVTNFDLNRYIKWLQPNQNNSPPNPDPNIDVNPLQNPTNKLGLSFLHHQTTSSTASESTLLPPRHSDNEASSTSALGILLQSSKFKEILKRTSPADCPLTSPESDLRRSCFPDDIQTYFDCSDSGIYAEGDDITLGDLNSFDSHIFHCEFEA